MRIGPEPNLSVSFGHSGTAGTDEGTDLRIDPFEEKGTWSRTAASRPTRRRMRATAVRLAVLAATVASLMLAGGAGVRPF